MTRLDRARISYLQMAEKARAGLQIIPESAHRLRFVRRHDQLIAEEVPLNEVPFGMEDLEPNGVGKIDFAVPRFLKALYDAVHDGVVDPTPQGLWNSAMADAADDVLVYHKHQELLLRLQQRHQGPGASALSLHGADALE